MVNSSTNVVDNICVWTGDINSWQPPQGYLMLIQPDVIAKVWEAVTTDDIITDWVLVDKLGYGKIGFIWDGLVLTTNEPKPVKPLV